MAYFKKRLITAGAGSIAPWFCQYLPSSSPMVQITSTPSTLFPICIIKIVIDIGKRKGQK